MLRVSSPINYHQVGCKSENVPVPAFLQELWRKRSPANIQPGYKLASRILAALFYSVLYQLSYPSIPIVLICEMEIIVPGTNSVPDTRRVISRIK